MASLSTATATATSIVNASRNDKDCMIVYRNAVCRWRLNSYLKLGPNYYIATVRALLRTSLKAKGVTHNLIGLDIEAFGYSNLRSAHTTAVYREEEDGHRTRLEPVTFCYQKSTATYKACRLYFWEEDFLPNCNYSFQYSGARDFETTVFLKNLVSMDKVFANAEAFDMMDPLPPSDPYCWDYDGSMMKRVQTDKKNGDWGNPDGPDAPFHPTGVSI